ncbi:MAG: enoyl-CoA hydratase [Myxococcota bacterium]
MNYRFIKVEELFSGGGVQITLASPPANIITAAVMKEISAALAEEEKNKGRKLVIFSGEGKHFSFGASVEEHKPELVNDMLPVFHKMVGDVIACGIPTLARVTGLCLGGGFELALACNFIFADETTKMGVPEIQLAVFPPVACILLPLKCGDGATPHITLTGGQFTAKELREKGVVNLVAETGKLDETIAAFYEKEFKPKSASSLRIAKKASVLRFLAEYNKYIGELESLYLKELMSSNDAKEGIAAFIEKRQPNWKNS